MDRKEWLFRPVGERAKDPRWGISWCVGGTLCSLLWQKIRFEGARPRGKPHKVSESCSTVPRSSLHQVWWARHSGQVKGLRGEAGTQPSGDTRPVLTGCEKMSRKSQETKERILPEKPSLKSPTGFLATAQHSPRANAGLRTSSYSLERFLSHKATSCLDLLSGRL